jgi:hypothetical protein
MDEFDYLQSKFIYKFDVYVENGGYYWKTQEELSDLTGIPIEKVASLVMFSGHFVMNSKGNVTTRKHYETKTPFFKKFQNTCLGTIL